MESACRSCSLGVSVSLLFFFFLSCYGDEASRSVFLYQAAEDECSVASDVYRTSYHFHPQKNWMNGTFSRFGVDSRNAFLLSFRSPLKLLPFCPALTIVVVVGGVGVGVGTRPGVRERVDPNAPVYFRGLYHLFYQFNPEAPTFGRIYWAHSVSADLLNWAPLELALLPTAAFDVNGCWSGSATFLPPDGTPLILYTGRDASDHQTQNVAFPADLSDRLLRRWTKLDANPIISPPAGVGATSFRDPTTAWLGADGLWRILVGAEIAGIGAALLYRSEDFVRWEEAGAPLHSVAGSGMWECPDFYPVLLEGSDGVDAAAGSAAVKHVLKMSLFDVSADYYMLGRYDEAKDVFVPEEATEDYRRWLRYDYGKFYASKSFFDSKKRRRILWAWLNESDSEADDIAKGWAGIQIIPRTIWLDDSGKQLLQWPVEELDTLRRKEVHFKDMELQATAIYEINGVKASQADVEVDFELPCLEGAEPYDPAWAVDPAKLCRQQDAEVAGGIGPFGLLVLASENLEENTAVFFRVYKDESTFKVLMCSDQRRSSLRPEIDKQVYGAFFDMDLAANESKISLRTLIDHSIVESFGGGGKACISSRVYPSFLMEGSTHLYVFNNGVAPVKASSIKAWDMAGARLNLKVEELDVEI